MDLLDILYMELAVRAEKARRARLRWILSFKKLRMEIKKESDNDR